MLDLSSYDVVSSFYPYALQYYTEASGLIHWLPICGIPETMVVNKTLLDENGIAIPENYAEFAAACAKLRENGIKPLVKDWKADYSCHSLIQGAALEHFTSLKGMQWRMQIESGGRGVLFDEELWTDIFSEVNTFIRDTGLTAEDAEMTWSQSYNAFVNRTAAITCATPANMTGYQSAMNDELVRLPYFSQTTDESWVYTYPSMNIALSNSVADSKEKTDAAMKVLSCFLSEEGQKIIAGGQGMISYNVDVPSDLSGVTGIEDEIRKNAFYIRYASNSSFSASLTAAHGIMTGELNGQQALESFESVLTAPVTEEEIVRTFENTYLLALNEKGGRDAASAVLTTLRKANGADIAFTPYYYYTASLYAGGHTKKEISMMVKNGNTTVQLAMSELTGREVKILVEEYLKDTGVKFQVTNKYELPVASGMKLIITCSDDGYKLKNIEVNGEAIQDDFVYRIFLSTEFNSIFKRALPDRNVPSRIGTTLHGAWTDLMTEGAELSVPEDYIKIEK